MFVALFPNCDLGIALGEDSILLLNKYRIHVKKNELTDFGYLINARKLFTSNVIGRLQVSLSG